MKIRLGTGSVKAVCELIGKAIKSTSSMARFIIVMVALGLIAAGLLVIYLRYGGAGPDPTPRHQHTSHYAGQPNFGTCTDSNPPPAPQLPPPRSYPPQGGYRR
ncbi:hypothetical protein [Nocardia nova]|jgi:hypothetical protein|uniref:hypothetical protein n=1 Tax=Nocardia nova TaxID=37330 RepID=UPI0007A4792F|nr:hypothetical protein [Nocardia nova]